MPKCDIKTQRTSTTSRTTIEPVYVTTPINSSRAANFDATTPNQSAETASEFYDGFERHISLLQSYVDKFLESKETVAQEILANQRYLMQLGFGGTPVSSFEPTCEGLQESAHHEKQHKADCALSPGSRTKPQSMESLQINLETQILSWQTRIEQFLASRDSVAQTIIDNQRFLMRICLTNMPAVPIEPNVEELQEPADHEDVTPNAMGKPMEPSDELQVANQATNVEEVGGKHVYISSTAAQPVLQCTGDESLASAVFVRLWRFHQSDHTVSESMQRQSSFLQSAVSARSVPLGKFVSFGNCFAIVRLMFSKSELNVIDLLQISNVLTSLPSAIFILLVDWAVSAVVSGFGLAIAWMFSKLNWDENFETLYFGLLVGSIFTAWNISQYASFAIQTTGHQRVMDHIRAVCNVGGCLVLCNLIGWCVCAACVLTGSEIGYHWRSMLVLVPSISSGVVGKTFCKLKYFKRFELAKTNGFKRLGWAPPFQGVYPEFCGGSSPSSSRQKNTNRLTESACSDALSRKVRKDPRINAHLCPFTNVSIGVVLRHALGPYTCFVYTLLFTVGNHYLYVQAKSLHREMERTVVRYFIFVGSNLCFVVGFGLLNRWIRNNNGVMKYSAKMCMAFYFIYGTVTELQIRLGLVQFEGTQRLICSILHPSLVAFIRGFEYVKLRKAFASLQKINALWIDVTTKGVDPNEDEACADIAQQYQQANDMLNRSVLLIASSMLTQNVAGILLSGMSCLFEDATKLHVGSCQKGFWLQVLTDNAPVLAFDFLTITNLVGQGIPLFYYFLMLDPFIIVAVLVVTYMCVCLVLFTVGLSA